MTLLLLACAGAPDSGKRTDDSAAPDSASESAHDSGGDTTVPDDTGPETGDSGPVVDPFVLAIPFEDDSRW